MKLVFRCLTALFLGLLCPLATSADDFNRLELVPGKLPPGYRNYQKPDGNGNVTVGRDGDNRYLVLTTAGKRDANAVGLARNFSARPGQRYRISFDLRNGDAAKAPRAVAQMLYVTRSGQYLPGPKFDSRELPADRFLTATLDGTAPDDVKELLLELHTSWNTPGVLHLDNVRCEPLTPDGQSFAVFGKHPPKNRNLFLETALVRDAKPTAVIAAATPHQREIARNINRAIQAVTGCELPVLDAAQLAGKPLTSSVIAIGNADDNPLTEDFYFRHELILDSRYPGVGGHNVRTVHNPEGNGFNLIAVGGSDAAGHRAAGEKLVEIIRRTPAGTQLALPRLAEIVYPRAGEIKLRWGCEWDGGFGYDPISRNLAAFYFTNDEKYIDDMLKVAFPDAEQVAKNNRMDRYDDGREPIAKPYHYWAHKMILYWDMVEESPVFSPELREKITRKFYDQMQYWIHAGYGGWYRIYLNPKPHTRLHDRHYLMEALCVYTVARYFDKYYPAIDSREGLRCAANAFAPVWDSVTPQSGWRVWSPSMLFPALQYALLSDYRRCRTSPAIRAYADYLLLISSWRPGEWLNGYASIYGSLARLYDDAALAAMQQLYIPDPDAVKIGPAWFRAGHRYGDDSRPRLSGRWTRSEVSTDKLDYPVLPGVDDFYAYRSRPDATGDYLLIAPKFRPGSRGAFFNNAIDVFHLQGQPLLNGGSQLYIAANALASGKPVWFAAVNGTHQTANAVLFDAAVTDYNGHDWRRMLLLLPGKALLAIDRVTAREDNLVRLENLWRFAPHSRAEALPSGDLRLSNGGVLPPPGAGVPVRLTGKEFYAADFDGDKSYNEFSGAATFSGGKSLSLPFEVKKSADAELFLSLLGGEKPAAVTVRLDGREIATATTEAADHGLFRQFKLGRHQLKAGRHTLQLASAAPIRVGGFFAALPGQPWTSGVFTLSTTLNAAPRVVSSLQTGPDGGAAVPGYQGSFVRMQPLKKGESIAFATVLVPGSPNAPAAAALQSDRFALRLPEAAELRLRDKGFELNVAGHIFRYDGKKLTETQGSAPQPAAMPAKNLRKPNVAAPELLSTTLARRNAPIGQLLTGEFGIAAAAGKTLQLSDAEGQLRFEKTLPGAITALYFWAKPQLLIAADREENIVAYSLDGVQRWATRSESAPEFLATNKVYWFKGAYPGVYRFAAAELAPGQPRLFAGSTGTLEVLTPEGKTEARFHEDYGPVTEFAVLPAENDHGTELFAARAFGAWPATWGVRFQDEKLQHTNRWMIEDHNRQMMNQYGFSGVGKRHLQTVELPQEHALLGAFDGAQNRIALWDYRGKVLAGVDLGAGEVAMATDPVLPLQSPRNIAGLAMGGDGTVFAATAQELLFRFGPGLKLRGVTELPAAPQGLAVSGNRVLVACDRELLAYDAAGKLIGRLQLPAAVQSLIGVPEGWLVGLDNGELRRIELPQ